MNKTCLECDNSIKGRADKKFCDDACRNAYNNRVRREASCHMRRINRRLSRNRKILSELNPKGKCIKSREELLLQGFDFQYFTSIYETQKGKRYYFVYEQGYVMLPQGAVALVRQKEYAKRQVKKML